MQKKLLYFDLSEPKPRGRHQSDRMRCLDNLSPGDAITLDHTGFGTSFSVWLAQARMRLHKRFDYERIVPNQELYKVWLKPAKKRLLAA